MLCSTLTIGILIKSSRVIKKRDDYLSRTEIIVSELMKSFVGGCFRTEQLAFSLMHASNSFIPSSIFFSLFISITCAWGKN